MPISEICNREVIIAQRHETVSDAAKLMRERSVGTIVVVEEREGKRVPISIVTDRDLVVEIIALEADPTFVTLGDLMLRDLLTVKGSCGVFEGIQYMRNKGVRRLPVVDDDGSLLGIVALDDLLALLAEELSALAKLVEHERNNVP